MNAHPILVCRVCGQQHYSPVCCPTCKEVTPHYAVLKGVTQPQPAKEIPA
jgi:rubrerythrin